MKNNFPKIPLILSIIFFIFFCFAFVFLYGEINDNNQKAEQNTIIWQTEARRRDEIKSLDRSIQMIAGDRALLETHFAKSSDIVPFLDTVEKLASQAGARAEVGSVDILANNAGLMVGLKASGSFEVIYKFLTLLENSPYELDFLLVDIHKLTDLDASGKNVKNSSWEAVFKIQLLSFIP
jgi:NAD(P)-dependent dehydrogenase (short-subunit alcohol dehydrogenase family)